MRWSAMRMPLACSITARERIASASPRASLAVERTSRFRVNRTRRARPIRRRPHRRRSLRPQAPPDQRRHGLLDWLTATRPARSLPITPREAVAVPTGDRMPARYHVVGFDDSDGRHALAALIDVFEVRDPTQADNGAPPPQERHRSTATSA